MCAEVDPVSGLICLDTSGRPHRRHHGLGFDSRGSWSVSWLDATEVRRLMSEDWRRQMESATWAVVERETGMSREELAREVSRLGNSPGGPGEGLTGNGPGVGVIH